MPIYLDVLMILNFLVDLLLLIATNRLSGHGAGLRRAVPAAVLGGVYGSACVIPGFTFLAGTMWRLVSLCLISVISFGIHREAVRRGVLFIILSMALGGVALGFERGGFWSIVLAALGVCLLCLFGFHGRIGDRYVQVCVEKLCFTALLDTGNTLTDPLTGQQILVVSPMIGAKLLGVDVAQLKDPVGLMEKVSGVRLVPFHAVGQTGGVLPVKRFDRVRIGNQQGSYLLAFAPNELGKGKPYEALTGGAI